MSSRLMMGLGKKAILVAMSSEGVDKLAEGVGVRERRSSSFLRNIVKRSFNSLVDKQN
jgi:hypothetical protein